MGNGYQVLHESAGQIDLSAHGRIRVTGEDRARLLHAMTTNHIQDLAPGTGCYAFFLNAVGRVLADANVLCYDDHFLLDTEPETLPFLMEHLDKYIIADDVTLEDITGSTFAVAIEGPHAIDLLLQSGFPVPDKPLTHQPAGPLTIVRATSTGAPGFRVFGPASASTPFADVPRVSADDARIVRLENFFPRYGDDITAANLPQETGITDALHFTKGCYLGQEIVERVRSRGHVNRMLIGLQIETEEVLPLGAKVSFEETEVGEITGSAWSPGLHRTMAMAYVRVNAAKPGTMVSVNGRPAQVAAIKSSRT